MQVFLIERAHVANIHCLQRREDPIWKASMAIWCIVAPFFLIWMLLNVVAYMAHNDGQCHTGAIVIIVAPILAFDVSMNSFLTIVFVAMICRTRTGNLYCYLPSNYKTDRSVSFKLRKIASRISTRSRSIPWDIESTSRDEENVLPPPGQPNKLRTLATKSVVGTVVVLGSNLVSYAIFFATGGNEALWICSTQCTLDSRSNVSFSFLEQGANFLGLGSVVNGLRFALADQEPQGLREQAPVFDDE
jgi:hypothetical protein